MNKFVHFYTHATFPVTVYDVIYCARDKDYFIYPVTVLDYSFAPGATIKTLEYKSPTLKSIGRTSDDQFFLSVVEAQAELDRQKAYDQMLSSIRNKIKSDLFTDEERAFLEEQI